MYCTTYDAIKSPLTMYMYVHEDLHITTLLSHFGSLAKYIHVITCENTHTHTQHNMLVHGYKVQHFLFRYNKYSFVVLFTWKP